MAITNAELLSEIRHLNDTTEKVVLHQEDHQARMSAFAEACARRDVQIDNLGENLTIEARERANADNGIRKFLIVTISAVGPLIGVAILVAVNS